MVTVAQVTQASDAEMLCLTYELFLERVQEAMDNKDEFKRHTKRAREVIKVLVNNLDFDIPISNNVFQIYVYVQRLLLRYETLPEAYQLIRHLQETFEMVSKQQPQRQQVMKNTQQIYAGATYSGSSLNEFVMGGQNRGFKA
ncbi:hypothetical protein AN640_02045 [Candidatus Epulonipiscium fishelsonii]|uniref:Uncharacterized protein n=1 Tax=Candidatus Epulonipiscium fishelsonii TaxID=77094 RepID=A0ACC8XA06_9FIRM|nr:hypothetical protein AN640_02045 [Epulopiscium sp. SCG-D08WGA-EpuloA1]OON94174.1 MAG: hypothetical protein ATN32_08385 [Epulopiscium sp. AS2M-Bin002]